MNIIEYNTKLDQLRHPIIAESRRYKIDGRQRYSNPASLATLAGDILGLKDAGEEHMYLFAFDTKNRLLGLFELSHGTINLSLASPRDLFIKLLILGAVYFTIAHNHPSGDPTPSDADIEITKKISEAGELLQVPLMDHVVVGRAEDNSVAYISMREQGLIT